MTNFRNAMMAAAQTAAGGGGAVTSVGNSALYDTANSENLTYTEQAGTSTNKQYISFWMYFTGVSTASNFIISCDDGSNNNRFQIYFGSTLTVLEVKGGSVQCYLISTRQLRDIGWYHIELLLDTTQSVASNRNILKVNNVRFTEFSTETNFTLNDTFGTLGSAGKTFHWGRSGAGTGYLGAYLAESVRIDGDPAGISTGEYDTTGLYWTPKSSTVIQELTFGNNGFYLANKVTNAPQLDFQAGDDNTVANSQISALLHMDGSNDATSTTDSSSYANTVTFAGNAHLDTGVKKFGTASLQLDGNGDYVTMPDSDVFDWGTGDFSISWSIYFTTIHTITAAYTNNMFGSSLSGVGLVIAYKNGANLFLLMDNTTVIDQSYSLSTGQWYQMEITRSGTSINWFIDGVSRATATSSANADKAAPLAIGASNEGGYRASDRDIAGYMDEIQIIKGRALHTANFTAPSAAYTDPISVASQGGGGGGGYQYPGDRGHPGRTGGSGGGAGEAETDPAAAGTTNQGYAGGAGTSPASSGSGGGGAGAVGVNAAVSGLGDGGAGGAGVVSTISGASVQRGGGGGGGGYPPNGTGGGAGGAGGGGAGASYNRSPAPVAGTVNTGGGGGGSSGAGVGTTGGSGIVIVRYKYK